MFCLLSSLSFPPLTQHPFVRNSFCVPSYLHTHLIVSPSISTDYFYVSLLPSRHAIAHRARPRRLFRPRGMSSLALHLSASFFFVCVYFSLRLAGFHSHSIRSLFSLPSSLFFPPLFFLLFLCPFPFSPIFLSCVLCPVSPLPSPVPGVLSPISLLLCPLFYLSLLLLPASLPITRFQYF